MKDKNNLKIEIQAELDEKQSKANITNDIKVLEKTPFFIRLAGKLYKALTKANIEKDLKELNNSIPSIQLKGKLNRTATKQSLKSESQKLGKDTNVTLGAEIDKKTLAQSIDKTTNSIEQSLKNNPVNIPINVDNNINNSTQQIQHLNNQVRDSKNLFSEYLTARDIFRAITESIKKTIEEIEKLNKAQTDLQIATSKSTSEMKSLMQDYNQLAKDMSSTTLDVTGAADDYLRQGQSVSDTNTLIKDSLILSKVGQIESSQATEYLTSAMKGYKTEAKDVINIVDKLSAVDLQSASSSGELAESMSMCANVARTSGVELDTLIAYLAVTKDVTQDSASAIGNAWKSVFTRLNNIKIGKFLDEDGNDISGEINDAERVLSKFNISLRDNAKEFRNAQDIIADVANAWDTMSSVEQAAVRKGFANTYQAEKVTALFENYNKVLELTEVSQKSAGTAMEKFSIYENSLEAATNRLTASFEGLAYNTIDSDFITGLTNGAAGIVEFVDSTKLLKTGLTAGIFTGAISGLVALGTKMIAVKNNVTQFTQAMNLSRSSTAVAGEQYDALLNSVGGLTEKQLRLVLSSNQLTEVQRLELMQEAGIEQSRQRQLLQTWKLTNATNAQTIATFSLRGAWEGLKTSIATNPIGLIVTALTTATMAISKYKEEQEEAKQKAEELRQQTLENAQAAKEELKKISDLISQYEKFKDVTSLTADDKETLKSIQDQLVETFGKEAEGIDLVNGEYREQLGLLKGIKQEKSNQNINALISNKDTVKKEYDDNVKNTFEYYGGGDEDFYHNSEYVTMIKKLIQNNPAFTDDIIYSGWGAQYGKTVGSAKITLSDNLNAEEKVQALQEALEYMRAEGYTDNELFRYFSNIQQHYQEEVDNYNNALKDLAQGYIDAFEPLNDDATLKEFNAWKEKLLKSIDDEEVKSATSELVDSLYKETSSVPNNTTILNLDKVSEDAKNALSEYEDKISDFLSEKDKIDSALKEQEENGSISASTAFELSKLGYKSAVKYDSETKAYKLLRSEINKTAESRIAETKAKLESEKASAIQSIKDETENWRKNTGRTKDDIMYLDKLDKNKVAINEISDAYDLYIRMLEFADDGTSEYADSIARVNEELEKQKEEIEKLDSGQSTIDKAIEEQKEFGHLSASSIKALHEAGLGTALAYNEATGETTLLIDSVEELYQAMIKAQEEAAKISLNNLATEIEEIENRLNNFTVNSEGDRQKKASLESDLAEKQSQYDTQQQNIQVISSYKFSFNSTSDDVQKSAEDAVEEYINSIKEAFDKEKSDLDHLLNMDVISQEEYYNRLFDLNEKYFKGKTELLDEYRQYEEEVYKGLKETQIKAIQEQIDALKSVNEEKQEEIDLEKAKQALENAKRNKTISVYDSERGWIRETDRNAIDSAQKEYDDLVEKVEVLENLIDAIENGTNTSHQLDESINAVEQANSITGQQFIENVMQSFANKGLDFNSMFNTNGLTNGADVYNSIMQGKITPVSSDSYTTNNNNTITLNGVTVMANNPEEFIAQMEDIADERFKENFPPAMNQFGRDLRRYQMNHSN